MLVAVEGCCHGELDQIYSTLLYIEKQREVKIDLLLICGDFQAIRNTLDLSVLACPEKYRRLGNFYKYYSGEKKAPIPTVFIGGNHEASNYLWELFHGGWVCPDIYFLGFAGVINVGNLRIGGLSGIYKKHDYEYGYYERQPLNDYHSRSIYHVRKFNVYRLAQIKEKLDVFMSHDWPRGIAFYGNYKKLIMSKPFFAREINANSLGSYPNEYLLKLLKPNFWFSAHLHVKFEAIYKHVDGMVLPEKHKQNYENQQIPGNTIPSNDNSKPLNNDDIASASKYDNNYSYEFNSKKKRNDSDLNNIISVKKPRDLFENDINNVGVSFADGHEHPSNANPDIRLPKEIGIYNKTQQKKWQVPITHIKSDPNTTRFLALDKCLPNRNFMQVIYIDDDNTKEPLTSDQPVSFCYDREWLSIIRATHDVISFSKQNTKVPPEAEIRKKLDEELKWVNDNIPDSALKIPNNFSITSPPHNPASINTSDIKHTYVNPQTQYICDLLKIKNYVNTNVVPSTG